MATLLEYAQIANKVYEPSTAQEPAIDGWGCSPTLKIDDRSVFSGGSLTSSGLQARVFLQPDAREVVIAYKGTVPTMASDLMADLRIVCEGIPRQAWQAMKLTTDWSKQFPQHRVSLVGHSLGGGIAQVVGAVLGIRFVTFNAPGMWTNALGICGLRKMANTLRMGTNYIKWGDAVGNFGKHIGDTVRVASTGHSIVGFIEFLKTYKDRDKDPLA